MIQLIIGPMFSGKTTELIRRLNRRKIAGNKVVLLRPKTDTRKYLTHDMMTHNLDEFFVNSISETDTSKYDVIGIDEGQFFTLLCEYSNQLANSGKIVIISGLNASSEQEPFNNIQKIIPYAEKITKMNAVCSKCGSDYASFSIYKNNDKYDAVKIGGKESYDAYCRGCWLNHINTK